jgi:hypothetical protein
MTRQSSSSPEEWDIMLVLGSVLGLVRVKVRAKVGVKLGLGLET